MKAAAAVREAWSVDVAGRPLLSAGSLLITCDAQRQLAAFEAATGRCVWRYPFSWYPYAIHDRLVVARAERNELHVLDVETGRPEGCIPHPVAESARIANGVFFAHQRSWREGPRVTAVDLATGRRLWMRVGEPAWTASDRPEALAAGEGVVLAGENGDVVALDAATGAERWRRSWPDVNEWDRLRPPAVGPLFVAGGRAVLVVEGRIVCLDLGDGRPRWDAEGTAHVVDGAGVYASVRDRYHVLALADGAPMRRQAAAGAPPALAQLLMAESRVGRVADGNAYLLAGGSGGEALIAVDRERGRYVWHHQPPGGHHASAPVAHDGQIFYVNANKLYALTP